MTQVFLAVRNFFVIVMTFISAFVFCNTPERATKDVLEDTEAVRVMSYNIRCAEYADRFRIVPQLIGEYMPDSVGIQECTYEWYLTLRSFLPEYEFIGVGRDNGKLNPLCGEISAVLYRKDKYKLVDSGTFWVSETPDKVSFGWDAACRRVCTWVILENIETNERYAHVNTHLDHAGAEARINGSRMVSEFALSFDIPTVLTGDFNFYKGNSLYDIVVSTGLRDTAEIAANAMEGKTYHDYLGGEEGEPIDYIFVNDLITHVETYKIVRDMYNGKYSSDHYPIYSDITF